MKFKKKNKVNFKPKKHDDTFETDYEEEVLKNPTKWYEEVPEDPAEFKPVTDQQLIELKDEAKKLHDAETLAYSTKNARTNKSSDYQWIRTVLAKGTSSDKIAAYTILIQDNPVFNLKSIQDLVGMVKVSKKKECLTVIQTLSELFLQDLLKPDVKLKAFHQRPLSMLNELTSGNIVTRKRRLVLWYFEDQLKETYTSFVQALTKAAHDTVEATKEKAINAMYHLLAEHPEQEKNLLTNIVNKLGDPSQKVAAKTIFCLGQLLFKHPNMKDIVLTEIEKLLFRSNVSHKAQYYSICFLSQYFLTHEDSEVAKHLITVYFAFFRSCVKKDEINSKMMSALLMGVNRAYPYAKLELNQVNEHIDTIYKVVHQANFNVGLHALALLFQVCDLRNSVNDRFYSALYKKMFDPNINVSTHQAMFLNLIFKAIKRDENVERINVFIKRLLQIALNTTVPMSCGILYTISQFCRLKKHKLLLLNRNTNHIKQDTSHSETIDDILAKDKKTAKNKTAESVEENTMNNHENSEKIIEENTLLVNTDTSITNTIDNIVKQEIDKENKHTRVEYYDPHHRNPLYAGGEFCVHSELSILQEHFHPSVALFSKNLVNGQKIDYSGDPLKDFTLIRFLDRFVFKNPKKIDENDESTKKSGYHFKFGQRKSYVPDGLRSIPITSNNYLKEAESKIPVDELFMYRFLQKKIQNKTAKAEDDEDIESDHESVNSDEFNEMLDQMVGKNKGTTESDDEDDVDFMNEVGDALKVPKTKSKKKKSDEVDEEESEDEQASIDDQDEDEFDEDDLNNDDDLELDSDDAEDLNLDDPDISDDDFDDIKSSKSKKKSGKSDDVTSAFASAEEFAMMLEKTGSSKFKHGTSNAMFNDDKSDEKQMAWEQKRNHWISGFNSALGKKRKSKNVIPVKGQKRKKPNHIQKGKKKN